MHFNFKLRFASPDVSLQIFKLEVPAFCDVMHMLFYVLGLKQKIYQIIIKNLLK